SLPALVFAQPPIGTQRPNVAFEDSWERPDAFDNYAGMPMLLLYEDRGSAKLNADFKKELTEVAQDGGYKGIVAFMPVADMSSYDYWPVRGFARRSVQKQSMATRTNIICDWHGTIRETLALTRDTSNVVLYDKEGKVVFAHAGAMPPEQRATLFALLKVQVDAVQKR
ncbi:MAG TPA: YtfJ family protein, partial [Myxococcota bacterium]|nr:YtfJ family protein [Myxococcota bacterium]